MVTPAYYDLMEKVSPRKSVKVILLKLLVTLSIYGPLTNGCVRARVVVWPCLFFFSLGSVVLGVVDTRRGRRRRRRCAWLGCSRHFLPSIVNHTPLSLTHTPHQHQPRTTPTSNQTPTTAPSWPPCPCWRRGPGPSTRACGCSNSRRSRGRTCSSGPSSTPSTSPVRPFVLFMLCVCCVLVRGWMMKMEAPFSPCPRPFLPTDRPRTHSLTHSPHHHPFLPSIRMNSRAPAPPPAAQQHYGLHLPHHPLRLRLRQRRARRPVMDGKGSRGFG